MKTQFALALFVYLPFLSNAADLQKSTAFPVSLRASTKIGAINKTGLLIVSVEEFSTIGAEAKERFVSVRVNDSSPVPNDITVFFTSDEAAALLKGIEGVLAVDKSSTSLEQFEATYSAKHDFDVFVTNHTLNRITKYGVRMRNHFDCSILLDPEDFKEFNQFLLDAEGKLFSLKAGK